MLLCLLLVFVVNLCTKLVSSAEVCSTPECKNVSQFIYSFLDTKVDPCVDMYTFACGGWIQKNAIPKGQKKWSLMDQMREKIRKQVITILEEDGYEFKGKNSTAVKKLKQFYSSCRNVQKKKEKVSVQLKKLIDYLGSWTVTKTNRKWNPKTWNIQDALQKSHKLMGLSFWHMLIDDMKYILFYKPGLTTTDENSETNYNKTYVREHYKNLTKTIGRLLGGSKSEIRTKLSEVIKLEISLIEIVMQPGQEKSKTLNLAEFQNLLGDWINIQEYMDAMYGKSVVTSDEEIDVLYPHYFLKLKDIIKSTEKEVLANYIILNLLTSTNQYLHEDSSIIEVLTKKLAEKKKGLYYRQRKCLEQSRTFMKYVTSALYVDRHFSQETVVKVVSALNDIEHQFVSNLDQLTWLDEETKKHLKEKAEAMTNHIGYPDWILDPIKLDAMYENLVVDEGEYFLNVIHSVEFQADIERKKFNQPYEVNIWENPPENVDAYYYYVKNTMIVYAGLLQDPILSTDYPISYLYGTLGVILAHENVHGFDSTGRRFDKYGNYTDIWTPHVAMEFQKRTDCMIEQYSNYTFYGHKINGYYTLAENIADNGGVKMAYRAYKSSIKSNQPPLPHLNMTDDQLYFLGLSHFFCATYTKEHAIWSISHDHHTIEKFRAIGTVSNSKEFSEAFNCPVNSPMNPEKKCEVW